MSRIRISALYSSLKNTFSNNAYIPDNQFRSRYPKFITKKDKYGKRHQSNKKSKTKGVIPASEFTFDPNAKTCIYTVEKNMWLLCETNKEHENHNLFFEGRLTDCRQCNIKHRCMRNPESADIESGNGRQVSFIMGKKKTCQYTDWMKPRVDSDEEKLIYSHRMSVVDRLLLLHNLHSRHPCRSTCIWQYRL